MKNKKIYKIITFFLMITVLFSVVCLNASAYSYSSYNGSESYYLPDSLEEKEYIVKDFHFEGLTLSHDIENILSFNRSDNFEFNGYNEEYLGFNNYLNVGEIIGEYPEYWYSSIELTPLLNFASNDNPVVITFPIFISCVESELENFTFSFGYKSSDQLESDLCNYTEVLFSFDYLSDLIHHDNYGFDVFYREEGMVNYLIYVEALCDPDSNYCYFTFSDGVDTFSKSCALPDSSDYLSFILEHEDDFQTGNWQYFFIANPYFYQGEEEPMGISVYELKPLDEDVASLDNKIFLDGSDYTGMIGNSNNPSGYACDSSSTGLPCIKDGRYEFIKNSYSNYAQAQLWFPSDVSGFTDFSSSDNCEARLSFDISAIPRDFVDFKFVEGISGERWGPEWCISDPFLRIVPVSYSALEGTAVFEVYGWCGLLTSYTASLTDPYGVWLNISIDISLDSASDSIYLLYSINGEVIDSGIRELTTYYDSITRIYMNLNTSIEGTGVKFDNFSFSYVNNLNYSSEYEKYFKTYLNRLSQNESFRFLDDYSLKYDDCEKKDLVISEKDLQISQKDEIITEKDLEIIEIDQRYQEQLKISSSYFETINEQKEAISKLNLELFDYKNNADIGELFPGITSGIMILLRGVTSLGYTTPGGVSITIGGLLVLAVLGAFLTFILKMIFGRGD